jgi:hypothetical protein
MKRIIIDLMFLGICAERERMEEQKKKEDK